MSANLSRLCDRTVSDACFRYEFIRKGGKLPVYGRWIEGEKART